MNRRTILKTLGALVPGSLLHACTSLTKQTGTPNIILIYTDDQNSRDLSCYGGDVATPHIDGLARDGVRFTRYFPSAPVCTASRYNVLTGQYVSRSNGLQQQYPVTDHAFIRWNADFVPGDPTIAHVLKQHGYATGMVGKWHNGLGGWSGDQIVGLQPIAADADPEDPVVRAHIQANYVKICARVKSHGGFDYAESIYGDNFEWLPLPKALMYHNQDWITKGAVDFIEQNRDRPFFLYMSTTLPHAPAALKSLQADPRATPAGLLDEHLNVQPSHADVLRRAEMAGYRKNDAAKSRWAALAWIDDGVGAVLQKLDDLHLADRTMVMYASDNGTRGKMTCCGEAIPCIIRGGGAHGGRVSDELVSNIDFAPTIYELCGVTPPADIPMDGRSLLSRLTQSSVAWRDSLYLEITYTRAVLTKDWKYVAIRYPASTQQQITPENRHEFSQEGTRISYGSRAGEHVRYRADRDFPGYYDYDQLYDLRNDPMEQQNLAPEHQYIEVLDAMKQRLTEYSGSLPHKFGEFTG